MKKIILFLISILLCSCSFKSDYYTLSVDDYEFTVGYDNVSHLKLTFDMDVKDSLDEYETINDIDVRLFDNLFCNVDISNYTDKKINVDEAVISKLTLFVKDVGNRKFKINDIELDNSVKSNCDKFNGKYIEKNGYACVIENSKNDLLNYYDNVIELHGDYLNIDQDELDHIIIYLIKENQ